MGQHCGESHFPTQRRSYSQSVERVGKYSGQTRHNRTSSRATKSAFSIGDFALFVYNLSLVTDVISFFGTLLVRYKQAGVSMGRMADLLQGEPPEGLVEHGPVYLSGPLPGIPVAARTEDHHLDTLEARELTYHYPSSGRGIEGVSLRVRQGQCVVITGRVGAGKTTLLRVLLGLAPMDGGAVYWNG